MNTRWPDRPVPDPVAELLSGQTPEMAELYDVTGAALRRFEAIGGYLGGGPDCPPLVVVLDDLHWADIASLRLLAHLAESVAATRWLLVATYRPHESGGLAEVLAALARVGAGRIELGGLSAEEAHALVQSTAGREVSAQTAVRLHARTDGNPFFLGELVRLSASEQRLEDPTGGEAALALGDTDAAFADLAIAIEIDERMGALPWLAKAREAITRVQRLGAKPTLRGRQAR